MVTYNLYVSNRKYYLERKKEKKKEKEKNTETLAPYPEVPTSGCCT